MSTISALSTPSGTGALGIIRLSGPSAISIVQNITTKNLSETPSHNLLHAHIYDGNAPLDDALISIFRAPASFTGEDIVELSCHGSPYILSRVLTLLHSFGAIPAKPGEFTRRAYLNHKLDLTQAEAVADLIASESAAAHHAAIHHLKGGLSKTLHAMRASLIKFSALIELGLDFAEEDVTLPNDALLLGLLDDLISGTKALIDTFTLGNALRNGIKIAIIGPPNAGKSTLLNTLLGEDRAITSPIPGTTRDSITETLHIGDLLFRLTDTAGIRAHTTDTIEQEGISRAHKTTAEANIIILVTTAESIATDINLIPQDSSSKPVLIALNKADIQPAAGIGHFSRYPMVLISALYKTGIENLKTSILKLATANTPLSESTIITSARHQAALTSFLSSLFQIKQGLLAHLPPDLLSTEIRNALQELGSITGVVVNEDLLDFIFREFCIGK